MEISKNKSNKITCMDVHPGDYVLVESFSLSGVAIARVKAVYENYALMTDGSKYAYSCLKGITIGDYNYLEKFDFLFIDTKDNNQVQDWIYRRDTLTICPVGRVVSIGFPEIFEGISTSDFHYLHEVQHWYFEQLGKHLDLNLKNK